MRIIELIDVYKTYPQAGGAHTVLHGVSLRVEAGEFVAICGPSGNGKTTLLNLIGGIDHPSRGRILVAGAELSRLNDKQLTAWRGERLGIVFQAFQLLPALSLLQNVSLPMEFLGRLNKTQRQQRARQLLADVGLQDAMHRLPSQVSGGQQQRAAVARALANDPPLIIADEPTGNLDPANAQVIFDLFGQLSAQGKTLALVTHNLELAAAASRRIELRDGRIHSDSAARAA